ncbi:DDE-domain-containing protein [Zopfia rhizophila CBS 207.26]|uniref:DDE-domain-containing protein n=1 Tax=Zopfia rhizophila CBS 207.26 TaxID=1314779 RepID=A0A6A6EYA2_9PEZI|nr:DDE-domain-containing protein [Zopfia rhizophila CBS 207.26]
MPAHSSHILQPLDVGCFSPLKRAYRRQVEKLMRNWFNYITKLEFLPAFRDVFNESITKSNVQGSFQGAGLVLFNLDEVILKLDVRLRMPTPPTNQERKRKRIQKGGVLSFGAGQDKSTKDPTTTSSSSKKGRGKVRADGAKLTQRRCGNCGGTRHNARTCEIDEDSTVESSSNENSTITNSTIE